MVIKSNFDLTEEFKAEIIIYNTLLKYFAYLLENYFIYFEKI